MYITGTAQQTKKLFQKNFFWVLASPSLLLVNMYYRLVLLVLVVYRWGLLVGTIEVYRKA